MHLPTLDMGICRFCRTSLFPIWVSAYPLPAPLRVQSFWAVGARGPSPHLLSLPLLCPVSAHLHFAPAPALWHWWFFMHLHVIPPPAQKDWKGQIGFHMDCISWIMFPLFIFSVSNPLLPNESFLRISNTNPNILSLPGPLNNYPLGWSHNSNIQVIINAYQSPSFFQEIPPSFPFYCLIFIFKHRNLGNCCQGHSLANGHWKNENCFTHLAQIIQVLRTGVP